MATKIQPLSDFITSRNRPRNKSPWPRVSTDSDDLSQLLHIFPDIDREYARLCLQQYTHGRVAAVTEKLLDKNFTNYPRHVTQTPVFAILRRRISRIRIRTRTPSWTKSMNFSPSTMSRNSVRRCLSNPIQISTLLSTISSSTKTNSKRVKTKSLSGPESVWIEV
jgi:hypothetical protein